MQLPLYLAYPEGNCHSIIKKGSLSGLFILGTGITMTVMIKIRFLNSIYNKTQGFFYYELHQDKEMRLAELTPNNELYTSCMPLMYAT